MVHNINKLSTNNTLLYRHLTELFVILTVGISVIQSDEDADIANDLNNNVLYAGRKWLT